MPAQKIFDYVGETDDPDPASGEDRKQKQNVFAEILDAHRDRHRPSGDAGDHVGDADDHAFQYVYQLIHLNWLLQ